MIQRPIRMEDVLKYLKENPNKSLFPMVEYIPDEYSINHGLIDTFLLKKNCAWSAFGFDVETFLEDVEGLFAINYYKYKKLADTLDLEYNPIENYSMTEEGIDTHTGTVKDDMSFGKKTSTDTTEYGEQNANGITNMGNRQTTVTEQVSPMDRGDYVNRGKNTTDSRSVEDMNSQHINEHTDTLTRVDEEHSDNNLNTRDLTDNHKFKRSGNIGVTTSQQMLESERAVANFSFYLTVWEDVIRYLLIRVRGCSNACEGGYFDF